MTSKFSKRPAMSNTMGRSLLMPSGPWSHRTVNAAGVNFHVAIHGPEDGTPVLLLHSFPRTWLSWKHTLVSLGDANWRAIAMDLRGFGNSDLQPHGQDPLRMSADISAVISALGYTNAHVIGAGLGGILGWILASTTPKRVRSLMSVCSPHPLCATTLNHPPAVMKLLALTRAPYLNRALLKSGRLIDMGAQTLCAPGSHFPLDPYHYAFSRPFAAETALEATIRAHALTHKTRSRIDTTIDRPVSTVMAREDPLHTRAAYLRDQQWVQDPIQTFEVPGGHYATEEAPAEVTKAVFKHLEPYA